MSSVFVFSGFSRSRKQTIKSPKVNSAKNQGEKISFMLRIAVGQCVPIVQGYSRAQCVRNRDPEIWNPIVYNIRTIKTN